MTTPQTAHADFDTVVQHTLQDSTDPSRERLRMLRTVLDAPDSTTHTVLDPGIHPHRSPTAALSPGPRRPGTPQGRGEPGTHDPGGAHPCAKPHPGNPPGPPRRHPRGAPRQDPGGDEPEGAEDAGNTARGGPPLADAGPPAPHILHPHAGQGTRGASNMKVRSMG